jgi:hypothetical protein
MRVLPFALILTSTAAFAQLGAPAGQGATGYQSNWSIGGQSYGPMLTGHFQGIQDGQNISVDLDTDLGLARTKTTPGLFINYQGPRFGLQVSNGNAEYRGDRVVSQKVTIGGVDYIGGTRVQSHLKLASVDGIWTIKFTRDTDIWMGLDLGAQVWTLDMDANDVPGSSPTPIPARSGSSHVSAPIPQVGLSAGARGFNGAVEAKAYAHYLGYKQAKYTLFGADLRVYPVSWFGLRAFYEGGSFDVPKGSIKDDLEFKLDRKGVGLGAIFRF